MSNTTWTPAIRYAHDADELTRLAEWLGETGAETKREFIALDYFRLADRLQALADDAREFARTMGGPIP